MPPPQAFGQEDLVDAAPLDRDALLLVEVGLQAVQRPGAERQAQVLRVGQGGGDDLGALLGRVSRRPPGPRLILQAVEPPLVEAMDPGVDRRARDAEVLGDLAGPSPVGEGQEDVGPLDEAGLGCSRRGDVFEGLTLPRSQFAECDSGKDHGCTSLHSKTTPFLRRTASVSSLRGCTTKSQGYFGRPIEDVSRCRASSAKHIRSTSLGTDLRNTLSPITV
jgi:hypothetical protein